MDCGLVCILTVLLIGVGRRASFFSPGIRMMLTSQYITGQDFSVNQTPPLAEVFAPLPSISIHKGIYTLTKLAEYLCTVVNSSTYQVPGISLYPAA